jgi:glycolate oxidase FAD binding subunit
MTPDVFQLEIVAPDSTEQVAEILRAANQQGRAVEVAGAGTKRGWGNAVDAAVLLDTRNLAGVRVHSWQDLTATVAAGTVWSTMQRALAQHGQRVALDPLWAERATVGGVLATNDSGSLRLRHGSLRDLIIGMTIVLADGTVAKSGGKVVKNVAGYDLHKLMIGAFGTLGVVTEVTFRLHPLPKAWATWTLASRDIEALDRVRHGLADSTMSIESLQLRTCEDAYCLDVRFASLPDALEDHVGRLRSLAGPLAVDAGDEAVWLARESVFGADRAMVKVTMPAAQIAALTSEVAALGGQCVAQQSGIMIASLAPDAARILRLRESAEAGGGSLAVLDWPEELTPRPDRWGEIGASLPLMREIKRRFDPHRILNPGRFVGGI